MIFNNSCKAFSEFSPDQGVYVIEETSGKELVSHNKDKRFEPASTTKLLTALVMFDHVADLNETVICGQEVLDYDWRDSEAGLWENQQTNYKELLYAMLLPSGNDAAGTIAVNVGRKILGDPNADKTTAQNTFVEAMNKKADELGLINSNFTNPSGRDDPNHYTTPADFAKVVNEAYKNETIVDVSRSLKYTITSAKGFPYDLFNTDMLLYPTNGDIGVTPDPNMTPEQQAQIASQQSPLYTPSIKAGKTGTNSGFLRTFVFETDVDNGRVIGVLFNFPSEQIFSQSKSIIDEVNNEFSLKTVENNQPETKYNISNTFLFSGNTLEIEEIEPIYDFKRNSDEEEINYSIRWNNNYIKDNNGNIELINDIETGDKVGSILLSSNGQTFKTIPIYSKSNLLTGKNNTLIQATVILMLFIILFQITFVLVSKRKRNSFRKRKIVSTKRSSF